MSEGAIEADPSLAGLFEPGSAGDNEEINAEVIAEKVKQYFPVKHANGIIMGKTGVGKTTLLNAYFKKPIDDGTGVGKSQTMRIMPYHYGDSFTIYDTRGIEMEEYETTFNLVRDMIMNSNALEDPEKHIHFLWYCLNEAAGRFEEWESQYITEISQKVPVIFILTQASGIKEGFDRHIRERIPPNIPIMKVIAKPIIYRGRIEIPSFGLEELTNITLAILPKGQHNALMRVTKYSLEGKSKYANAAIATAVAASIAAGASPIPFSDAAILCPIQITMLAAICTIYEIPVGKSTLMTIVGSVAGSGIATLAGRSFVTNALKLIPGLNFVAMGISGATAGTLTGTLGATFHSIVQSEVANSDIPSIENIARNMENKVHSK